ncbi:hypothetical protein [Companilactobacillus sp. DQM5]|uniref:hypothetical protein n=1 Tax=Companilactobacillus sp. DQM5 TaxID=3463359 RepID=UPI0040582E57
MKRKIIINLSIMLLLIAQVISTPNMVSAHWLYGDIENGVLVKQKRSVTPKTKVLYYPENPGIDPWKGGSADFVWEDTVVPTLTALAGSDALQAAKNGLNFGARINLPESITAKDVIDSLDYKNSYLYVGSAEPYVLDSGFFSYDNPSDHYLYFTMRKGAEFNKLIQWIIDIVKSIITNFSGSLDVKLVAKIDVNKLTKNGYPDIDKSPNQQLTRGMAPPSPDKKLKFGVNFYGHDQIDWDSNKKIKPKPGNENANESHDSFSTWNEYISPWDNGETFNTGEKNTTENWENIVRDGKLQDSFLPGPFSNREVSFKSWEHPELTEVGNRFNRIVNIYTQQDTTDGSNITHDIDNLTTKKKTTVTFHGTDSTWTRLSPRKVTFTRDDESLFVKLSSSAKNTYMFGESIKVPIDFTQYDTRSKKLSVSIQDLLSSTANKTNISVNKPGEQEQSIVALPSEYSASGKHMLILTFNDEFNRTVTVTYEYTVLDIPNFKSEKTLFTSTDRSTNTLTITPGEDVNIVSTFSPEKSVDLIQSTIKSTLPDSTSLIPNSTKLVAGSKIINISDNLWQNGQLIYNLDFIPKDTAIKLSYKVSTSKNDKGKTLPVPKDLIEAPSKVDNKVHTIGETNASNINIKLGELRFQDVTKNIAFGQQTVPDKVKTYHRQSPDEFFIKILDTYDDDDFNWTLSGKVVNALTDQDGDSLNSTLLLIQDPNLKNQYPGMFDENLSLTPGNSNTIYENSLSNDGILDFTWPTTSGPELKISNNQKFIGNKSYSGTIQWSLNSGPDK